ncbi:MAG TPA: Holliday junction branch migration protein RuvA [Rhodothermales bacterium]|nr:Holliday junction branch migration protein RuvA [Rhodothermales bacterium]
MIAYVSGKLVERTPARVVIDVHGVGLEVHIPASSFDKLPAIGESVRLLTFHYVREDNMQLFGFATQSERRAFESMVGVSGVGPRLALAALSALDVQELRRAILGGDAALLTRIPGVGRKTAERLVIELRDRFAVVELGESASTGPKSDGSARLDALAALESLGLSRAAAEERIRRAMRDHPGLETAEQLIKLALRDQ